VSSTIEPGADRLSAMSITLPVITESVITLAPIVIFMLIVLEPGMIPDMLQLNATGKDRHDSCD
jgi:hypothetical protein